MLKPTTSGFAVFAFCNFIICAFSHTVDDVRNLVEDKTKDNNKKYRPVYDQEDSVYVWIHFELIAIQEFDEVAEKFSVIGYLSMAWQDELLQWEPEDYGDMTGFAAEGGDFWQPRLVLTNPHGNLAAVGNDWDIFRYDSNGVVSVTPGTVLDATCSVDTRQYPWDEQECGLYFVPWGYLAHEVYLVNMTDIVGTTFYGGHGAWELVDTGAFPFIDAAGASLVGFKMQLRRKPQYVVVNVILPIVFMSFLNIVVFLIPTESGERISYSLTVLLAIAVFFTLVGDNLPKTSDPMSSLSYYLLIILVISVVIVFATVFNLRLYFCDTGRTIPKYLETIVRCLWCKCRKRNDFSQRNKYKSEQQPNFDDNNIFMTDGLPRFHHHRGKLNSYKRIGSYNSISSKFTNAEEAPMKTSRSRLSPTEDSQVSWKDVSGVLDVIFFFVFLCLLIAATVMFFVTAMTKSLFDEKEED